MDITEKLIEDTRINALLSWTLILLLTYLALDNFLKAQFVFSLFSGFIVLLAVLPALKYRDSAAMVPWEILTVAALPFVAELLGATLPGRYFSYLSTAGVAMILGVELHFFTEVRMNDTFAVIFVAITTVASAGAWALVRWLSDLYLGTRFLIDVHNALMWEFAVATFSGLVAGFFFDLYFRRLDSLNLEEVVE